MLNLLLFALLVASVACMYVFRLKHRNLPPGPVALPVIGHLHLLREPVHRTLQSLSLKHGPVFSLRLGSRLAVVVTSSAAAEECFTNQNDVVFANRPMFTMGKYVMYNYTIVSGAPYGDHWRNLRRLCALEIFSASRLNASADIRKDEVRTLLQKLHSASRGNFVKVELRPMLLGLTFNVIMRMVAGKLYCGEERDGDEEAKEFQEVIEEAFEFGGVTYLGDFLPVLRLFDFDGFIKRAKKLSIKIDKFLQRLVDEHRRNMGQSEFQNTMIEHLLSLQESQPAYYTDETVKGLVLAMLLAGTDTLAVTLEWALANLLNHPKILKKAKTELDDVMGGDHLIDESDIHKCQYLVNIISETLRLYPATPLLVPHLSSADCNVAGHHIPRGTILFVNAWAIHRDPNLWSEPEVFKPERFECRAEAKAQKLIPFGIGRRACPGSVLAQRVLGMALGSLIQCFEWERINDVPVDMSEGRGLSMPMAVPLVSKCKSSPLIHKLLS